CRGQCQRKGEVVLKSRKNSRAEVSPSKISALNQYREALALRMPIEAGTKLGRYEIRSKLGEGGMGEVYLAEDTKLHRRVAIKFLPFDSQANEQANKRLLREAQAAAKLDHPNICSIYEVGEENGRSFIVMQYVEGETLNARIKRHALNLSESLSIATQVADGLAEAHANGIIDRDIKPSNIMMTLRCRAKVMDFGLAKCQNRLR